MMNRYKVGVTIENGTIIQFTLYLTDNIPFETINKWNASSRYAYAYKNTKDGSFNLELDLFIGSGVTEKTLEPILIYSVHKSPM